MQILFTHGTAARARVLQLSRWQLALGALLLGAVLMLLSGLVYHYFFLKAAREGWPVVSSIVRLVVRDEIAQRDRFMRENLDAIAQKVGEVQAKLVRLEAVGERVSNMAGVKPDDLKPAAAPAAALPAPAGRGARPLPDAQGGLYVPLNSPTLEQIHRTLAALEDEADAKADLFALAESRLMATRLDARGVPSIAPVKTSIGSGFGFRIDPFTGRGALHTGLDFPAEAGTPITAAAGGIVLAADWHPQYGQLLEIDHGKGLVTRYAHCSKILVQRGDLVRAGQAVAHVGSTGRSTGPHLHFEVTLDGVHQDPARLLAGPGRPRTLVAARRD
jgi:murein DD-endopeptidase MepM/ murein hydrolase activator NlpD